ncbi:MULTISPECIES: hypothetical protein [Pseudoalteromonas]|uniref:hypothetical protein n=1 Tax=Pseudoalteromonas TaxID=53246 RepID=UPI0002D94A09|nr:MULTISPECIES: hypothetical protein [Pseudoalteromonas]MCF6143345.1 hypothetical protein [Pseudoalteromonas mariniglutinosa NCIMB 1770]
MLKKSAIALAISSSFFLSGCLDVKENNDDIVAAIENNNAQAELENVTLTGSVTHLLTGESVNNAQVSIKIGNDWSEPVAVSNGLFELNELPQYSDYVLLVSSVDGSFQERAFYGKTNYGIAQLGRLEVSNAETVEFEVLLNGENTPVAGLEFSYSISTAFNMYDEFSNRNEHFIRSTYDENTGRYSISKVKGFEKSLAMDLDVDNDSIDDFIYQHGFDSYNYLTIASLMQGNTLYVSKTIENTEFQVRIAVIDEFGNTFDSLDLVSLKSLTKETPATFDAQAKEYVFEYQGSSKMKLLLPSFTDANGNSYGSSEINLSPINDGVNVDASFGHLDGFYELENGVLSLVVKPYKYTAGSTVSLVSSVTDTVTQGLYLLVDSPIELVADKTTLIKKNHFTVIKGNDKADDFVPPGVTYISFADKLVQTSATSKFNSTFVTVLPQEILTAGNYRYALEKVFDKSTNKIVDFDFTKEMTVADQAVFDINTLKFDNNNGFTAGNRIVEKNTAGEAASGSTSPNGYMYFPESIDTLSYLKLTLTGYTINGTAVSVYEEYPIIAEYTRNLDLHYTASVAVNESIQGVQYNVAFYTSLTDGKWYRQNFSYPLDRLEDNQIGNKNDITFGYEYSVKGSSEVVRGQITLPVL